jgi:hypothetical protein
MDRDDIISDAYVSARGSLKRALEIARLNDKKINMDDIKRWQRERTNDIRRPTKYNSWVASGPKEEYQVDLFQEHKKAPFQLLAVDTFSKRVAVEQLKNNNSSAIMEGLDAVFKEMGGKPKSIYSDAEGGIVGNDTQTWLQKQGVVSQITINHAPLAEAMIKVIKNRVEFLKKHGKTNRRKYADLADQEAKIYNEIETPRALGMTPLEAEKPENLEKLKMRFEIQRKTANPQEKLKVGDRVRYFKKKDKFTKGYIPQYSELYYTINEINKLPLTGQKNMWSTWVSPIFQATCITKQSQDSTEANWNSQKEECKY